MFGSTFSCPRLKLEVTGQLHAPAALPSGEEPPAPISYEARLVPEPIWVILICRSEHFLLCPDLKSDTTVVQPVATRYTDCGTINTAEPNHDMKIGNRSRRAAERCLLGCFHGGNNDEYLLGCYIRHVTDYLEMWYSSYILEVKVKLSP
jgi:hypothetical protein